MPKGTKCPRKNLKYSIFNVIILKIKRGKILKKYLGFDLVIFYSLKFRSIIISQCFFVKWTNNTPKSMGMWCSRHGFFGLWDGSAFIYQASCRPRLLMLGRFFPSIKYNYIFAFFIFLLGNKFGQKSANFGPSLLFW